MVAALLLAGAVSADAATLIFERVTDNGATDISSDLYLEVTDLGGGEALFQLTRGDVYDGFLRNIYFQDTGGQFTTIRFEESFSSPSVSMGSGSSPANPPGLRPFETDWAFDADTPRPSHRSIGPGETGGFIATYSGTYDDVYFGLIDGSIRVAVHAQGLEDGQSDTFVAISQAFPIPEPSSVMLLGFGGLFLLTRRSRR